MGYKLLGLGHQLQAHSAVNLTEVDWKVFELIGKDLSTEDIAKLYGKKLEWVWRVRQKLAKELDLHGSRRLITTAVKVVWIHEYDSKHRSIPDIFHQFTLNHKTLCLSK